MRLPQISFSAIIRNPMERSHWIFEEGTRETLTSGSEYKMHHYCTTQQYKAYKCYVSFLFACCPGSNEAALPHLKVLRPQLLKVKTIATSSVHSSSRHHSPLNSFHQCRKTRSHRDAFPCKSLNKTIYFFLLIKLRFLCQGFQIFGELLYKQHKEEQVFVPHDGDL